MRNYFQKYLPGGAGDHAGGMGHGGSEAGNAEIQEGPRGIHCQPSGSQRVKKPPAPEAPPPPPPSPAPNSWTTPETAMVRRGRQG